MKVLLVEDDPDLRAFVSDVLIGRGHEVVAHADGCAAWQACAGESFPLVVADWGLPGMDGLELCRRLRRSPQGDRPVVLVVTGRDRPADVAAVLAAGADDYLAKPFGADELEVRLAVAERQTAVQRARAAAEAQVESLLEAVRLISASGHDLDATLDALAEQARRLLGADAVSIHLTAGDGRVRRRHPHPFAAPGSIVAETGTDLPLDAWTTEAVVAGRPAFAHDFQAHAGVLPAAKAGLPSVVSALVVPLLADDGMVGVLFADWNRPVDLTPADVEAAGALGRHAATAIRSARLLEEARAARAEAEAVLNASGDCVLVITPDGRVVRTNTAARRLFSRVLGKVPSDLAELRSRGTPVERPGLALAAVDRALAGEAAFSETIYHFPDGEVCVSTHASPAFGPDGGVSHAVVSIRDVTDLQRALIEHARLEGAVKTARRVVHDLGNHLQFVTGYGELLSRADAADAAEMVREIAQAGREAAATLARLQRIVRFEERDAPVGPMLDLEAASRQG